MIIMINRIDYDYETHLIIVHHQIIQIIVQKLNNVRTMISMINRIDYDYETHLIIVHH
jgi:hypothetical protein